MALPRIDTPVYDLTLPLSKKKVKFRPFLVKESKILLMAIEANDKETIDRNVKQILSNCTLSDLDIEQLPVVDVEYYFLNLRAKSVGEIVENKYICNNKVDGTECGNSMKVDFDLTKITVEKNKDIEDTIQLTDDIYIKLTYPKFSTLEKLAKLDGSVETAFGIVAESIEYIYDGDQYYYASETDPKEMMEFIENLNTKQFEKIEAFFKNLPKIKKTVEVTCSKCGFEHKIELEGLESFFG